MQLRDSLDIIIKIKQLCGLYPISNFKYTKWVIVSSYIIIQLFIISQFIYNWFTKEIFSVNVFSINFNINIIVSYGSFAIVFLQTTIKSEILIQFYRKIEMIDHDFNYIRIYVNYVKTRNSINYIIIPCITIHVCIWIYIILIFSSLQHFIVIGTCCMNLIGLVDLSDAIVSMNLIRDRMNLIADHVILSSENLKFKLKIYDKICNLVEHFNKFYSTKILAIITKDFYISIDNLFIFYWASWDNLIEPKLFVISMVLTASHFGRIFCISLFAELTLYSVSICNLHIVVAISKFFNN